MGFRDNDESRRAKIDALLAEREEHEERIVALEERLETLEVRLATQEARTEASPDPSKAKPDTKSESKAKAKPRKELDASELFQRRWRAIFAVAGVSFLGAFFMMFRSAAPEPVETQPAMSAAPRPVTPSAPTRSAEWEQNGAVDLDELLEAVSPPEFVPPVTPIFTGHVTLATSSATVEEGAPCEVRVMGPDRLLNLLAPESMEVRCGGVTLYEIGTAPPCTLRGQGEIFGGLFTFACEDRGIRDDRPEMELRSVDRHLRIWSEGENWMVTIVLDQAAARVALSRRLVSSRGLPLMAPQSMTLRVQEHQGDGAPSNNTLLTLAITESAAIGNCAFVVREGRRVLGQSEGRCLFDSQLTLIGVDAGLTEARRFGLTMDLREERVSIESSELERSWAAQAIIETDAE